MLHLRPETTDLSNKIAPGSGTVWEVTSRLRKEISAKIFPFPTLLQQEHLLDLCPFPEETLPYISRPSLCGPSPKWGVCCFLFIFRNGRNLELSTKTGLSNTICPKNYPYWLISVGWQKKLRGGGMGGSKILHHLRVKQFYFSVSFTVWKSW